MGKRLRMEFSEPAFDRLHPPREIPTRSQSAPRPKSAGKVVHLTESQKEEAKANAKKAGRRYPNLIDNMNVAKKAGKPATKE